MKSLVNPFLWYIVLQAAGLVALQRRATGRKRAALRVLILLTLLLAMASTPLMRRGLEFSLVLPPTTKGTTAPSFIFVLGGGYVPGEIPDEDLLVLESQRRVLHAVTLWRRHPSAHIVFSGAMAYPGRRGLGRHAQLMADAATNRRVPPSAVLLEGPAHEIRESIPSRHWHCQASGL